MTTSALSVSTLPSARGAGIPVFTLAALFLSGLAASFVSGLLMDAGRSWRRHSQYEAVRLPWVIFLKDGADPAGVESALRSLPGAAEVRFVSKDEALESARRDPALGEGLSLTGKNPFPASFEVRWSPAFLREDLLESHSRRLAEDPAVDFVDYDRDRVARFTLAERTLHQGLLALESVFSAAMLLLLGLVGRLLFFVKAPGMRGLLAGSLSGAAGAGLGVFALRFFGVPGDPLSWLAGALAAGILLLSREGL